MQLEGTRLGKAGKMLLARTQDEQSIQVRCTNRNIYKKTKLTLYDVPLSLLATD